MGQRSIAKLSPDLCNALRVLGVASEIPFLESDKFFDQETENVGTNICMTLFPIVLGYFGGRGVIPTFSVSCFATQQRILEPKLGSQSAKPLKVAFELSPWIAVGCMVLAYPQKVELLARALHLRALQMNHTGVTSIRKQQSQAQCHACTGQKHVIEMDVGNAEEAAVFRWMNPGRKLAT
eukprot:5186233-Amphidinium_carterae.1